MRSNEKIHLYVNILQTHPASMSLIKHQALFFSYKNTCNIHKCLHFEFDNLPRHTATQTRRVARSTSSLGIRRANSLWKAKPMRCAEFRRSWWLERSARERNPMFTNLRAVAEPMPHTCMKSDMAVEDSEIPLEKDNRHGESILWIYIYKEWEGHLDRDTGIKTWSAHKDTCN